MAKKAEPDDPRGEVKRQPGARAYAAQAQRYLDEGDLDEALRICRAGFDSDPDFEEGALTYLRALAQAKDLETGAEVFSTAARRRPRSATLRVAWARVLLDARRADEARDLAREATDIDPNHADALELLASLGETPPGHKPAGAPRAAALRAWVRPVGQRTSATSLFDLSAPPATAESRRGTGKFMFDAPPTPLEHTDEQEPPDLPVDPLSVSGERDLFPEYTDPGLRDPSAPAPPPTRRKPPRAAAEPPPAEASAIVPRPTKRRRWGVPLAVALVLVAAAGAGVATWRWYRDRQIADGVAAAVALCDADTREAFSRAQSALQKLGAEHGAGDPRIAAAQALVQAHLLTRFGDGQRAAVLALATRGQGRPLALLARALLEPAADLKQLSAIDARVGGWHLRLLRLGAYGTGGDSAACQRLLEAELRLPRPAPAVLTAGVTLFRRRGETARAARLAARAREISPTHVGAAIEAALLQLGRGALAPEELRRLSSLSEGVPAHRAKVTLLIAAAAHAAGKVEDALALLKRAASLAPDDADVLWYSVRWRLGPGGDAAEAWAVLEAHRALLDRSWPDAPLLRAQALLLLARPAAAREALAGAHIPADAADRLAWRDELAVRAAHAADDEGDLQTRCAQPRALRVRVACIEALLDRAQPTAAKPLAAAITEPEPVKAYVAGLLAIAAGDQPTAITALRAARKALAEYPAAVRPAAPWLAMARAHAQRSRLTAALSALRRALPLDAASVPARIALVDVLIALGQDPEARVQLDAVLAAKPTAPGVLAAAGDALLTLGLADKARALVEGHVTRSSAPAVRIIEGRVALADGKLDRAGEIFRTVLDDHPRSAEAMIALGRVEAALHRRAQAQRLFAEALKLRPKEPQLLLLFAQSQAQLGRYRDALPVGIDAVRMFKEQGQTWRAVDALITLGRLFRRGDAWAVSRAEELLFEAVKNKEAPAIAFLELGRVHRKLGDSKRQIWCLKQAIDRDPKLAVAHRDLGLALRGTRRTRKEAQRALRAYLRLSPDAKDAPKIKALLKRR